MSFLRIKTLLVAGFSFLAIAISNPLLANEKALSSDSNTAAHDTASQVAGAEAPTANAAHEAKEFNVTETILEHIKDDHS